MSERAIYLDAIIREVVSCLSTDSAQVCPVVCVSWAIPAAEAAEEVCESKLAKVLPFPAAQAQVRRLSGEVDGRTARHTLHAWQEVLKRAQHLENAPNRRSVYLNKFVEDAKLGGHDIFAACKRAELFGESPVAAVEETKLWLVHVLDAVETCDFEASMPAWERLADQGHLGDGGVRWVLELAHLSGRGSMSAVRPLFQKYPSLMPHATAHAKLLDAHPIEGQYSWELERLRGRHIRNLLQELPN